MRPARWGGVNKQRDCAPPRKFDRLQDGQQSPLQRLREAGHIGQVQGSGDRCYDLPGFVPIRPYTYGRARRAHRRTVGTGRRVRRPNRYRLEVFLAAAATPFGGNSKANHRCRFRRNRRSLGHRDRRGNVGERFADQANDAPEPRPVATAIYGDHIMTTLKAGARIARQLQTTEKAVDSAMVATSALIQAMIEGRGETSLAAEVGHTELTDMVVGLQRLNEARGLVVRTHSGLAVIAEQGGVGWRLDGPYEHKLTPQAIAV